MSNLTIYYLTDDKEFVVFNKDGKEVEWIDPVLEFHELSRYWVVYNGAYEYRVYKRKNHHYKIRKRVTYD